MSCSLRWGGKASNIGWADNQWLWQWKTLALKDEWSCLNNYPITIFHHKLSSIGRLFLLQGLAVDETEMPEKNWHGLFTVQLDHCSLSKCKKTYRAVCFFEADDESWTSVGGQWLSDAAWFRQPMWLDCTTQCTKDEIQAVKLWATWKLHIKK